MPHVLDQHEVEEMLELERNCYCIKIWDPPSYAKKSCDECKGTGRIPTSFGNSILEFTRKYLIR